MAIQNKEHALGGHYKAWYHQQPKLIKIIIIPFLIGISVIVIEAQDLNKLWFFLSSILLFIHLYNQYLDTVLNESLDKELENTKSISKCWQDLSEQSMYLNSIFNELVENKSEMFLDAITTANTKGQKQGIKEIRSLGSFKNSLDRIVAMIYKVFEKHAHIGENQTFRVCYLVPDTKSGKLIAKSWYNSDKTPPFSVLKPNSAFFSKGDSTVAGNLWARNGKNHKLIDDVEDYKANQPEGIFEYTHSGQSGYLKAIYCYKVMNMNECIGIICVDTNIANTLQKNKQFYKNVLGSFAKRIVFESRCAYMKNVLSREDD